MNTIQSALALLPAASDGAWVGPVDYVPATGAAAYVSLLVIVPLAAALFLLLAGKRSDKWGHWVGLVASWFTFFLGLAIFIQMIGQRKKMAHHQYWMELTELSELKYLDSGENLELQEQKDGLRFLLYVLMILGQRFQQC